MDNEREVNLWNGEKGGREGLRGTMVSTHLDILTRYGSVTENYVVMPNRQTNMKARHSEEYELTISI